jgi:hypothetical protein
VLPEMVQRKAEWNSANLEGSWLDGLCVHALQEHKSRLQGADLEDQNGVGTAATKDYYWEVIKSLARLVERLQQRIVELEDRLSKT